MKRLIVQLLGRHVSKGRCKKVVTSGMWHYVSNTYEYRGTYYEYTTGHLIKE